MKQVLLIDYEAGNIFNVARAFEYLNCHVKITDNQDGFAEADFLVLPGVGAFGDGIDKLKKNDLIEPIMDWVTSEKPFFGICLGMQLLMSSSDEFGYHKGLNIIPGQVCKLPYQPMQKVPNIGWQKLIPGIYGEERLWRESYLQTLDRQKDMYFVHSYAAYPENPDHWLAHSKFGEHSFCSVIKKDNIFASQFHPEKSGQSGLEILNKFVTS